MSKNITVGKTPPFLAMVSQFNDPRSLHYEFRHMVEAHNPQWRDKDWANEPEPPTSPFWLYKFVECVDRWRNLQAEIEREFHRRPVLVGAGALLFMVARELADTYRGAWVAEVCAAGIMSDDLSPETQRLVFALLDRAEKLRVQLGRKKIVSAPLRADLLDICDQMLRRYDELLHELPPTARAEREEALTRQKHFHDQQMSRYR